MKKVFFALILEIFTANFVCADTARQTYVAECLSVIERPKVEVTSSYGKLVYNFDKDGAYLRREMEKKFAENRQTMPEDFIPTGLTKVRDGFNFELEIGQVEISHGYSCLYPQTIKAHLGYYVPTIYILNDLDKDSCMYALSLRHEKTHMQIYIEALDYFLPEFKKTAEELFGKVGVAIVSKGESAAFKAEELNEAYKKLISEKVEKWRREVEAEQLKLDSPENYILENKLCAEVDAKGE